VTRAVDEASKRLVSVQDQLLRAERRNDELDARVTTFGERSAELEHHLEDAEQTRTQLEDEVAVACGRREEVERLLAELGPTPSGVRTNTSALEIDRSSKSTPEEAALAELERSMSADELEAADAATSLVELRVQVGSIVAEVAILREVVAEIATALAELAELPRNLSGRPREGRMRDLAIEIGIKDAELTLLNLGVSSLQQRVAGIVASVADTRQAMSGRSASEMKAIMDRLTESLVGLV
jgi:chromosome segregation ATPase